MSNITVSASNATKPAPKWFRKLKKAVGVLTLAANVMVQSWGLPDPLLVAKIQLWCTIGIGALLEAFDIMLANGEVYAPEDTITETITVSKTETVVDATDQNTDAK